MAGKPLSVVTDVYSLGVVLYELLTGERPYRVQRDSAAALEDAILAGAVALASSRCTDRSRRRALRGDVDAMLAKALARNPARRYASIESFAADIHAWLEGKPVLARVPGRRYRTVKFVRRHRVPVIAAALVALSLVAGVAGTWLQARRAQEQAALAQRERDLARAQLRIAEAAVEQFHVALSAAAIGALSTQLAATLERQVVRRYADDPAMRSRLLMRLAALQYERDDIDDAQRLVKHAREAAVLANDASLAAHADCEAASIAAYLGRTNEAIGLSKRAHAALSPPTIGNEPMRLDCHAWSIYVHTLADDLEAAEAHGRAALEIIRAGGDGRDRRARDVMTGLGIVLGRRARFAEAVALYEQARERTAALGLTGSTTDGVELHNLSNLLTRAGQPLRALQASKNSTRAGGPRANAPAPSR